MASGEFLIDIEVEDKMQGYSENDDGDDDAEDSDVEAHGPLTSKEKKRFQDQIFKSFAAQCTEQITEKEVKEAIKSTKDEDLPIRDILAKQETSVSISPRDYQTELYRKAKEENIIAVLDTGSGKTHIATLLLRHILDTELEARAQGGPHKIAFFLVNSVNLVFQQANVLRCGLDQKVKGICGAMGTDLWGKPTWETLFAENMVIICTAEVLVQCMNHSFISIPQVNLLIFDEAHHAKGNHPYARIIKDHYLHEPDLARRPRIFGMTASPVDANVNIKEAARELETLLHCKIATTSDLTLLANHINRPEEHVVKYDRLRIPFETPFHQEMKRRYGRVQIFSKFFEASKLLSSELGGWASDMYWTFAFSEEESSKIEMRQDQLYQKASENYVEKLNKQIAQLREAADFVRQQDFIPPTPTADDLSSKVLELYHWLIRYYEKAGNARCIVFVERRYTARLLYLIFSHIGGPHLHSDMLVGSNSSIGELNVSLRSQIMTVAKFRRGERNCLFSTSVAEEGLDIPQCNLVVRFDLYRTMIGYVQSRGRARHKNSKYLHMVESGNDSHYSSVFDARTSEKIMRDFCSSLSSDRIIDEVERSVDSYLAEDSYFRSFTDPVSKAKLTYRSSLSVLGHFVSCLPYTTQDVDLKPNFVIDYEEGHFICEVILPEGAPITSMRGQPHKKKAIAKCSAAFEMCLELRKKGFFDANLLPTIAKKLPAMRNAMLAINSKKRIMYNMRVKPEIWNLGKGLAPEALYMTVVDTDPGLDRPHQPLGFITRCRLPQIPHFPIYLIDGRPSNVISIPLLHPLVASNGTLKSLNSVTLAVYRDLFAKEFEDNVLNTPYWIVPLKAFDITSITPQLVPESLVDWEQMNEICEKGEYLWTPEMPNDFLADKFIVDPHDGGRRFFSVAVVPHLKPDSPVPEDAPSHKYMKDILDYSISLWTKSRSKFESSWDRNQPVMEVEKIPFRRNFLACVETSENSTTKQLRAYVCPQPLKISAISPRFATMCYMFPAFIYRFESHMVALDACKLLDLQIGPKLSLEALTQDCENSDEQGEEKINFQRGMGDNYERLEFMGDCFLKMATSISVFVQQPNENEFEFHVRRMCMLCNKNLMDIALKYKLYEYIRTMAFSRRTWYPEGLKLLKGKGAKREGPLVIKHPLRDKAIADICEALIGAAFVEYDKTKNGSVEWKPQHWDEAVKAVRVLVNSEDHPMNKFSDYYAAYELPKYQIAEATASQVDMARQIEQKHPYHFKYPRLLRSAFIHPSRAFIWEHIPNYQRLEFLGDALLDQAFITHLFYRFPKKDPQWLTEHKMPMVSNKFLGAVCVKLGFHKHIRQNSPSVSALIRNYVVDIEEAEQAADGAMDYWRNVPEPPKCVADVVEAYVAAMFVDSEFNFNVVQTFFNMHLKPFFVNMELYDDFAKSHPVTRLAELMNINFGCRQWSIAAAPSQSVIPGAKALVISMVQIHFKVWFHAIAESSRYGKPRVAKLALREMEGLPPYEFRRRYNCNCDDKDTVVDGAVEGEGVISQ